MQPEHQEKKARAHWPGLEGTTCIEKHNTKSVCECVCVCMRLSVCVCECVAVCMACGVYVCV